MPQMQEKTFNNQSKIRIAVSPEQLLNLKLSKAKVSFQNLFNQYKKLLYEIENSELEIGIVLACCQACTYTLIALIVACLFSSI